MGGLILGVNTLYRVGCFFKLFIIGGKGLIGKTYEPSTLSAISELDLFCNFERQFSCSDDAHNKI